jgi:hypothetical protein
MQKYQVMYQTTIYTYINVEADSIEEAKEIANNRVLNGEELIEDNIGVWQYDHIYDENGNIIDDNEYSPYLVTEDELFGKYGYLMDENHGRDVDLLVDIMKCNGVRIEKLNNSYLVIDDMEV